MVESLHCQLKAGLSAQLEWERWIEHLSVVHSLKADLGCTTAEIVYGAPLRLLGDFFTAIYHGAPLHPQDYFCKLRRLFHTLQPTPPRQHSSTGILS